MDFRAFDRARRQAGPLELDLVESYAKGSVSRREFVRRGALIGLSLPFMSAIISACGSSGGSSSDTTSGSAGTSGGTQPAGTGAGKAGGTIKVASQKPAGPLDPVAMQDLGSYGIVAQSFEFLATLGDNDIAPGLAEKWSPNADGSEWTFQLRKGVKWQDGTDFTSADVAATMDRLVEAGNSGLKGVIDKGAVDATDPNVAVVHARRGQRQLPLPRLGLQRPVGHHAQGLRVGHDAGRQAQRHRTVQAGEVRPRDRSDVRPQRRLVGWEDAAGRVGVPVLRRAGCPGHRRHRRRGGCHRAVPGPRR